MGYIEKRARTGADGSKTVRYRARYRGPDGRERSRSFSRKIDAERFVATTEADKVRGTWTDPRLSRVTFERWAGDWMRTTVHLKRKTRASYDSLMRVHLLPAFGAVPIGRIEPRDVQEWVAKMAASGLGPPTIRQAYRLLSAALGAAVQSQYLGKSPCVGVTLPRLVHREMAFLSAEQVVLLASAVPEQYQPLVYTLAYGGLRWGEGAAIRRSRCDLLRSRLDVRESLAEVGNGLYFGPTKTYEVRTVALPAFLRDMLEEHMARFVKGDPAALLFTSPKGGPLRYSNFRMQVWLPALESLEWGEWLKDKNGRERFKPSLRIHDLRHTCAALLIARGAHPKAVQVHLGHSSIQITMDRYGHLFPDDMERLADGLEETYRESLAAPVRPKTAPEVLQLPLRRPENAL